VKLLPSRSVNPGQAAVGRPPATSHAAIEAAAFTLFAGNGFDETTTDDIAEAAGIGRRTLFRYYSSKYDIPWGQFDTSLAHFRDVLAREPQDIPLWMAVHRGVVQFNTFDDSVLEQHRARMRLILQTPSLQTHSVLMYERWRAVIADYVAQRTMARPDSLLPRTVGHVSLALAISAYEQWLKPRAPKLPVLLDQSMSGLRHHLAPDD
jgi:TetR/AcrR family transcriptional regulator, regulator of mycofactocin system